MRLEDFKAGDKVSDLLSDNDDTAFFEIEYIVDRPTPIQATPLSRLFLDTASICFNPERLRKVTAKEVETAERDPIEIHNWGSDRYMLVAFGWHNIKRFKDACFSDFDGIAEGLHNMNCPIEHCYYAPVPDEEVPDGYTNFYEPCTKEHPDAVPLTVWWE